MTLLSLDHAAGPSAPRMYSGQETARRVGLSWQRFRKVRADWTRDRDFPAEINEPGEAVRYLADPVDRWLERRSRRVHAPVAVVPPPPSRDEAAAASAGRAQLRRLKGAAPC